MKAHWIIKPTGEHMTVIVTNNHHVFESMIKNHPLMKFVKWSEI